MSNGGATGSVALHGTVVTIASAVAGSGVALALILEGVSRLTPDTPMAAGAFIAAGIAFFALGQAPWLYRIAPRLTLAGMSLIVGMAGGWCLAWWLLATSVVQVATAPSPRNTPTACERNDQPRMEGGVTLYPGARQHVIMVGEPEARTAGFMLSVGGILLPAGSPAFLGSHIPPGLFVVTKACVSHPGLLTIGSLVLSRTEQCTPFCPDGINLYNPSRLECTCLRNCPKEAMTCRLEGYFTGAFIEVLTDDQYRLLRILQEHQEKWNDSMVLIMNNGLLMSDRFPGQTIDLAQQLPGIVNVNDVLRSIPDRFIRLIPTGMRADVESGVQVTVDGVRYLKGR